MYNQNIFGISICRHTAPTNHPHHTSHYYSNPHHPCSPQSSAGPYPDFANGRHSNFAYPYLFCCFIMNDDSFICKLCKLLDLQKDGRKANSSPILGRSRNVHASSRSGGIGRERRWRRHGIGAAVSCAVSAVVRAVVALRVAAVVAAVLAWRVAARLNGFSWRRYEQTAWISKTLFLNWQIGCYNNFHFKFTTILNLVATWKHYLWKSTSVVAALTLAFAPALTWSQQK